MKPKKYSIALTGHKTSISIEPIFWELLQNEAAEKGVPFNHLVMAIDQERIQSDDMPNLSSALRVHVVRRILDKS